MTICQWISLAFDTVVQESETHLIVFATENIDLWFHLGRIDLCYYSNRNCEQLNYCVYTPPK